ncbi:protein monoglycylase TTLL8 isoform X2 [Fukomys damarensis]|uniref:protein monoglycylase TTLL8 isoform X2 n=1 Tax=Fukomys damarensis TaxID=885580 RepID=UPI0005402589|nr:protein monoglycylase TTLL8 isoform X2 [Fukomys damarensis]
MGSWPLYTLSTHMARGAQDQSPGPGPRLRSEPAPRPRPRPGPQPEACTQDRSPGPRPRLRTRPKTKPRPSPGPGPAPPSPTAHRHTLPCRPRSPTPRAGCRQHPGTVTKGHRRTRGSSGRRNKLTRIGMEQVERTRLSSTLSDGADRGEKLKQGISRDSASSPKIDRYKMARQLTEKAIKEKKIFAIFGHYPVIRATLRRKGWVEKKSHFLPKVLPGPEDEDNGVTDNKHAEVRADQEVASGKAEDIHEVMSRLLKNETPYFLWTVKRGVADYHNLSSDQMLNHYGKTASFTTKIGLCVSMRSLPWFVRANPDAFFPRCYSLCTEDDFRCTMASSILKWVVSHQSCLRSKSRSQKEEARLGQESVRTDPEGAGEKPKGLPGKLVDMACRVCQAYLGQREHEDIDRLGSSTEGLSETEWSDLTRQYYALVRGDAFIFNSRNYFSQCQALLNKIKSVNPQTEVDGLRNIWIIKPAAKSRGRDIVCMDRLEDILALVAAEHLPSRDNRWVVQKYIETPLLIYDTKFDIRQWFLVTDWNPLTIWFYKESYLRFSTRRFSLDSLDSAIHLCNNAIQKHLQNEKGRSPLLPSHNMWSSTQFQEYLQGQGHGAVWGSLIYPSMKRAVTHAMKVAQGHVEPRKNSFELYGADFVLGQDFRPWLIEINSSPTMHPSTPVTAQLCAQVQEDTIKVVVDRRLDRNCDIGHFELLWWQPAVELPPFSVTDVCVEGVSVRRAKRQMPPIPTVSVSALLPEAQMLKVSRPSAMMDLVGGPFPTPVPRDGTLGDKKVSVPPWPAAGERGRGVRHSHTEPHKRQARPTCSWQPMDSVGLRSILAKAQPARLAALDSPSVQPLVPVPQSLRMVSGALNGLPPAPGPPSNPTPCLVCSCSSTSLRPCKRCGSFSAAILRAPAL